MEHAEHVIMSPGPKELFALINLLIVVAIVYFAGRRGIRAMVKDRSEGIQKRLIDAQLELERMSFETEKARREIADIESTREKFIGEIREEGLKLYENLVAEAKMTATRILSDAKLASDNEVRQASQKLKELIVNRAIEETVELARRPEGNDLKKNLHEKLLERFLSSAATQSEGAS